MLLARRTTPAFVGVIHLGPLPGAPRLWPFADVLARAVADARALVEGGADACVVENFGDAPFTAGRVDAATVAAMTRVVLAVRDAAPDLPLGVNVLRNDAVSALGIAAVVGAAFVRVNVLTGAMVTDQGIIEGCARELLLERRRLGAEVGIVADVLVKHAVPLGNPKREDVARDTWSRGGADVLVVTGAGTGLPTAPEDVAAVRAAVPDAPLWIGSGLDPARARQIREAIDGAIVGTWLHEGGHWSAPLDARRVAAMREALAG